MLIESLDKEKVFKEERMEKLKTAKIRPGADCRSNHELLIAKFRLKLKKVGKTTQRRQ